MTTIAKTNISGQTLLNDSRFNKGSAFTSAERELFNLTGLLPARVETIAEQCARCYQEFKRQPTLLDKNIYLTKILNQNETLFYKLVYDHVAEMLPIIYTPVVSEAVEHFNHIFQRPRGLFLSYPERDSMEEVLRRYDHANIDIIIVTDGERILGIGDHGVGGMSLCIGKLALYTLCAGIHPSRTLPICIDIGTNNKTLLNDPLYLGWRHERLTGQKYDHFIDQCVMTIKKIFPDVLLHWEDFGRDTARKHLDRYQNTMCTFNDDMQGTAAVSFSAIESALQTIRQDITQQCIVFFGAGTAATGIADFIVKIMVKRGLSLEAAQARIWLLGRRGLLMQDMDNLMDFQKPYAKSKNAMAEWKLKNVSHIDLFEVVRHVKPTILVGCSTVKGAFTETIIKTMVKYTPRPIILALSNPNSKTEATPHDLLNWTNGKALIATGSPFPDEVISGKKTPIAQCNNLFIFPGLSLGVISVKAKRITHDMFVVASHTLAKHSPAQQDAYGSLLPDLTHIQEICFDIAVAVAEQAIKEGVAHKTDVEKAILANIWEPNY
ncbi:MAG: hypothetical protein A3C55_00210 [Gammaproteobacteria bacterium RIFCSPHIGHO2_02_FULL_42_13]|nr:MAG: hypothetical protein A3C55_00210 [Gammaproteobacteria bacterium RIFCSPHIGHO2_02_FULL_42_13]